MEERNDSQGLETPPPTEAGDGAETLYVSPELQLVQEAIVFAMEG